MGVTSKEPVKMKAFPKGQIVIPVALRKKYSIEIGDRVDVISKDDGIFLRPVPKKERKKSLTDSLFGMFGKCAEGKPEQKKRISTGQRKPALSGVGKMIALLDTNALIRFLTSDKTEKFRGVY